MLKPPIHPARWRQLLPPCECCRAARLAAHAQFSPGFLPLLEQMLKVQSDAARVIPEKARMPLHWLGAAVESENPASDDMHRPRRATTRLECSDPSGERCSAVLYA